MSGSITLRCLIVSALSLLAGIAYYVTCRPNSAYYRLGDDPMLCLGGVANHVMPDFLWGMAYAAALVFTGCSFRCACLVVVLSGFVFEICQHFAIFNGQAYILDVVAYAIGAYVAKFAIFYRYITSRSAESDRSNYG